MLMKKFRASYTRIFKQVIFHLQSSGDDDDGDAPPLSNATPPSQQQGDTEGMGPYSQKFQG